MPLNVSVCVQTRGVDTHLSCIQIHTRTSIHSTPLVLHPPFSHIFSLLFISFPSFSSCMSISHVRSPTHSSYTPTHTHTQAFGPKCQGLRAINQQQQSPYRWCEIFPSPSSRSPSFLPTALYTHTPTPKPKGKPPEPPTRGTTPGIKTYIYTHTRTKRSRTFVMAPAGISVLYIRIGWCGGGDSL